MQVERTASNEGGRRMDPAGDQTKKNEMLHTWADVRMSVEEVARPGLEEDGAFP